MSQEDLERIQFLEAQVRNKDRQINSLLDSERGATALIGYLITQLGSDEVRVPQAAIEQGWQVIRWDDPATRETVYKARRT